MSAQPITGDAIAQQYGLKGEHGTYAWRVILNSPLDSERCRVLIAQVARPDHIVHQRKPTDPSVPFTPADPTTLVVRDPPHASIEELFAGYGQALALACASQLGEAHYAAWSASARPLLALLKECTFLPGFAEFARADAAGKKLYNAYVRGLLKLVKDGAWVDHLASGAEIDEDEQYDLIGGEARVDVLGGLLVALPTILNIVAAIESTPAGPANANATQYTRAQLQKTIDKLVQLTKDRPRMIWNGEEGTELGDQVGYVYDALVKVVETLRA